MKRYGITATMFNLPDLSCSVPINWQIIWLRNMLC